MANLSGTVNCAVYGLSAEDAAVIDAGDRYLVVATDPITLPSITSGVTPFISTQRHYDQLELPATYPSTVVAIKHCNQRENELERDDPRSYFLDCYGFDWAWSKGWTRSHAPPPRRIGTVWHRIREAQPSLEWYACLRGNVAQFFNHGWD